jgi:hypothetical protein
VVWRTKHATGHAAHALHDAKREAQVTGVKAAKSLVGH